MVYLSLEKCALQNGMLFISKAEKSWFYPRFDLKKFYIFLTCVHDEIHLILLHFWLAIAHFMRLRARNIMVFLFYF